MKARKRDERRGGYTLVEVLVASAILLIGISAASSLSLTMVTQEELNYRISRSLGMLENYARLYQLGLDPGEIAAIMPLDPAVSSVTAVAANSGNLESQIFTMTISPVVDIGDWTAETWTAGSQATPDQRQAVVRAFRPSIR